MTPDPQVWGQLMSHSCCSWVSPVLHCFFSAICWHLCFSSCYLLCCWGQVPCSSPRPAPRVLCEEVLGRDLESDQQGGGSQHAGPSSSHRSSLAVVSHLHSSCPRLGQPIPGTHLRTRGRSGFGLGGAVTSRILGSQVGSTPVWGH